MIATKRPISNLYNESYNNREKLYNISDYIPYLFDISHYFEVLCNTKSDSYDISIPEVFYATVPVIGRNMMSILDYSYFVSPCLVPESLDMESFNRVRDMKSYSRRIN